VGTPRWRTYGTGREFANLRRWGRLHLPSLLWRRV